MSERKEIIDYSSSEEQEVSSKEKIAQPDVQKYRVSHTQNPPASKFQKPKFVPKKPEFRIKKKISYSKLPMRIPGQLALSKSHDSLYNQKNYEKNYRASNLQKLNFETVNGESKQLLLPRSKRGTKPAEETFYHKTLSKIYQERLEAQEAKKEEEELGLGRRAKNGIREIKQEDLINFDEGEYIRKRLKQEEAMKKRFKLNGNLAETELETSMMKKAQQLINEDLSSEV